MMRIWFNHWFSTAYHFINSLKDAGHYVIATNERSACVYRTNADEFYTEDVFDSKEAYLDWALDFTKSKHIDVFFVKRNMDIVVDNVGKFEDAGIRVICPHNRDMFHLFADKKRAGGFIKSFMDDYGFAACSVPDMDVVCTVDEFRESYARMKEKHGKVCIKYNNDEGAQSYKLISDRMPNIGRITENNGLVYTYDYVASCLETAGRFQELIVMPYLEGPEVSIDCLKTPLGTLLVARYKLSSRVTNVTIKDEVIDIAEKISHHVDLDSPYNIQLRKHKGRWHFMEINTRLSGGAWKDSYIGIDFAVTAACSAVNELKRLPTAKMDEITLSNIENCIILN